MYYLPVRCLACVYLAQGRRLTNAWMCRYHSSPGAVNANVTLTDGTPVPRMFTNTQMTNPQRLPELGESHTYLGHLNRTTFNPTVTAKHTLVLFHYVTRSLEDYTSRKIALPSGIYTHNYVQYGKTAHVDIRDKDVMARFEKANNFDGTAPVCRSARQQGYVKRCCSANAA